MAYKVFLVEDEIVTREGIRDSVEWASAGYQFCGEAPDGEMALPLIRERQPEVVITDIKMPFMDGLQLCRILRETLPSTKIIILSGHDEFKYAQEAIKIGVTEYLLKPIAPQDLITALHKVAQKINQERETSAYLESLQEQMADHRTLLRERCLLDLLAGHSSPADFIAQASALGIDLPAPWYQVVAVRAVLCAGAPETPLYTVCGQIDAIIAGITAALDSVVSFKQGLEETVLIVKGESPAALQRQAQTLADTIRRQVAAQTSCLAAVGIGEPTERLGMVAQSFAQALARIGANEQPAPAGNAPADDAQPEQRRTGDLIARAQAYIDEHYADPDMSLSQVAAHVLLSPAYFSATFGREVGETFVEYLTNVRIRKAIKLLRTTSLTSSEIAYQVGYNNPRYFYSVFRKVAGLPPNEYRRQG